MRFRVTTILIIIFSIYTSSEYAYASFPVNKITSVKNLTVLDHNNSLNNMSSHLKKDGFLSDLSIRDKIVSILLTLTFYGILVIFIKCLIDRKWSRLLMIPITFLLLLLSFAIVLVIKENDQWFTAF
jgi:hypothetical protein